jgi:hypothetical protein
MNMSSNQGISSKAATSSQPVQDSRREQRLHIAVPVKVYADLKTTDSQTCCTYEISLVGVRLVAPQGITQVGQVVSLQRHGRRARFKVIWIGKPGTPHEGQVGVETLEPQNVIWDTEIKARLLRGE